jgi:hypothetical protein
MASGIKFRSLKPAWRRRLIQAACLLPLISLAVRVGGLNRTYASLNRFSGHPALKPLKNDQVVTRKTATIVNYLQKNGPYRGNCLSRSLLLWWMLQRRGIVSTLVLGVRRDADGFTAHAWVEYQGQPLNAREQVRQIYTSLDVFSQDSLPKGYKLN